MKSKFYVSSVACLSIFTLASCGGGDGGLSSNSPGATSASATPVAAAIDKIGNSLNPGVPGWPSSIAMGAIGGPNTFAPVANPVAPFGATGEDNFGGTKIDAVFSYSGQSGNGDPGVMNSPLNTFRMLADLGGTSSTGWPQSNNSTSTPPVSQSNPYIGSGISSLNNYPTRLVKVVYTSNWSGGPNTCDFYNTPGSNACYPVSLGGNYFMARHFVSLGADAQALNKIPILLNGSKYYGSIILNPDMLGTIQSTAANANLNAANAAIGSTDVSLAIKQALCTLTTPTTYLNTSAPNGNNNQIYLGGNDSSGNPKGKLYSGTLTDILNLMLSDGYPTWKMLNQTSAVGSTADPFWNNVVNQIWDGTNPSKAGQVFNACAANPVYDTTKYNVPTFAKTLDGWIQATNWLISTLAPKDSSTGLGVTYGWHENMFAATTPQSAGSDFWVHGDFSTAADPYGTAGVNAAYSSVVANWLTQNAPSAVAASTYTQKPDFLVFDRYEHDDSLSPCPTQACLYNARAWDNFLTGIGQVSKALGNIPLMMWQMPGAHIPNVGEEKPNMLLDQNQSPIAGNYLTSTLPVYLFGDSNLKSDLSNMTGCSPPIFTGSIVPAYTVPCPTCGILTVSAVVTPSASAVPACALAVNSTIVATNVTSTAITAILSGSGGVGTYALANAPQTVTSVSMTTASDPMINVGNASMQAQMSGAGCKASYYNCLNASQTYQQFLTTYQGKTNNYDWGSALQAQKNRNYAAQNNVFAILWGGGNTTNVIANNPASGLANDYGYLAGKIKTYFQNPTPLSQ